MDIYTYIKTQSGVHAILEDSIPTAYRGLDFWMFAIKELFLCNERIIRKGDL